MWLLIIVVIIIIVIIIIIISIIIIVCVCVCVCLRLRVCMYMYVNNEFMMIFSYYVVCSCSRLFRCRGFLFVKAMFQKNMLNQNCVSGYS